MRKGMLLLHRYVGLGLTLFLVVIGLTGSIIAFFTELYPWLNADLLKVTPQGEPLSVLDLKARLEVEDPQAHIYYLHFPDHADDAFSAYAEGAIDPATGEPYELDYDEVFANPYSGERLGARFWGDFSFERKDLFTFLYYLHYSLVLPEALGESFMGYVALVWAVDCFVGLYLTLPLRRRRAAAIGGAPAEPKQGWWRRWKQSWLIERGAGKNRLIHDIHRAVSLWIWLMLLLFAVSGFSFNLPDTYAAIMRHVTHFQDIDDQPWLDQPLSDPAVSWTQALDLGRKYMDEQAALHDFTIEAPAALLYRRETGIYYYHVHSDRDVLSYGATSVGIDAMTGQMIGVEIPTGHLGGNTFTSWIMAIHTAMVGGLPMKIIVSLMGLTVVALSVTGVLMWSRKHWARLARRETAAKGTAAAE